MPVACSVVGNINELKIFASTLSTPY